MKLSPWFHTVSVMLIFLLVVLIQVATPVLFVKDSIFRLNSLVVIMATWKPLPALLGLPVPLALCFIAFTLTIDYSALVLAEQVHDRPLDRRIYTLALAYSLACAGLAYMVQHRM